MTCARVMIAFRGCDIILRMVTCSLLDLKHVATLTADTFQDYINRFDRLIWRLWRLPRPVAVAVAS